MVWVEQNRACYTLSYISNNISKIKTFSFMCDICENQEIENHLFENVLVNIKDIIVVQCLRSLLNNTEGRVLSSFYAYLLTV